MAAISSLVRAIGGAADTVDTTSGSMLAAAAGMHMAKGKASVPTA